MSVLLIHSFQSQSPSLFQGPLLFNQPLPPAGSRLDMASTRYTGPSCRDLDNTLRIDAGSCRGGFDFSLLFEESILQILPIALMLIVIPFRLWQLSHTRDKVTRSLLIFLKLVSRSFSLRLNAHEPHRCQAHNASKIYISNGCDTSSLGGLGSFVCASNRPGSLMGQAGSR